MSVTAISVVEVLTRPGHSEEIASNLFQLAHHSRTISGCLDAAVICSFAVPQLWILSIFWECETAMQSYFLVVPDEPFADLLTKRIIESITFKSFYRH
ncbi:antibiotic biosynthesis monooxygenase [Pseudomonas chengduensis]|jgi:quinol monooxygenase YgiN|nr:antibiotic biosynthesis monooxygenase [Pseudomonas chengduensis]MBG0846159.1 antibiotic biosynthesis monooxygenase [Pseudomonas chengduensis]